MSVPIPLRRDFSAARLRGLAKKTKDGPQARRLLTLAAIYDGAARSEAAKIGGVGVQIIRDWVLRFNARGPEGLLDRKPPGQPSKLNDGQRQAIAQMIESGPIPAVHGVVRWRLIDLAQWIFEESASPSPSRRSAGSCGLWVIANSRLGHVITRRAKERLRLLKKLPRASGGNRAREGDRQRQDRNLVRGRGSYRPEEPAPRGDCQDRRARRPRRPLGRSGGIALVPEPVEIFSGLAELDDEVAGEVLGLDFAALLAPEAEQGGLVVAHDDPGVGAADEVAAAKALRNVANWL
jgi:transposase